MNKETLYSELTFKAVRSSGAGGQHVNKVSSKVEVYYHLTESKALSDEEKDLLKKNLASRLTKEGILKLSSDESRSQHTNKEKVVKRLFELLSKKLVVPKKRKPTKISKSQKQKRLDSKKNQSVKKNLRKKPDFD